MGGVTRGHGHRISGASDESGLGREDRIGIETLARGRREAATAYDRPEFGSLTHDRSRDRVVYEGCGESIQTHQTRGDTGSVEFAAYFIVRNLGDDDHDSSHSQ